MLVLEDRHWTSFDGHLRVVAEHPCPLAVDRVVDGHIGVDGAGLVVRVEAAEAVVCRVITDSGLQQLHKRCC